MPSRLTKRGASIATIAGSLVAGGLALRARYNRTRVLGDPVKARLSAPLEGRPIAVEAADGTRINAREFGPEDAPTVVLGHGWTCSLEFWTLQIQDLARDHRVVAWELRGHGESDDAPGDDYSIETLAGDLDAVLAEALRPGERAVVAGHSLGAMTLVAWAGEHPDTAAERLAAAALINTGVGGLIAESLVIRSPDSVEWTRDLVGRIFLSAAAPLPPWPNPITYEAIRYLALGPSASPAVVQHTERMVLACGPHARAGCGATMSKLDLFKHVAELKAPALVVAGGRDRLTPPVHARRLVDALADGSYVELPGIGHMAPLESPAEINGALRELVRTHLSAAHAAPAPVSPAG